MGKNAQPGTSAIKSPAGMRTRATAPKPSAEKAVFAACQAVECTGLLAFRRVLRVGEVQGSELQHFRASNR